MKTAIAAILTFGAVTSSHAQSQLSIETGISGPWGYGPGLGNIISSESSYLTPYFKPNLSIGYQQQIIPHLFVGGKITFENYTYTYQHEHINGLFDLFSPTPMTTDVTRVHVNSNYLSIAPILDVGLGRRGIVHFFVMPDFNIMIGGTMQTDITYGYGYSSSANTSSYLNNGFFKVGYGISEHIPVGKYWQIIFTETLSNIAAGSVARTQGTNGFDPTVNYFSLQFGVMHKYHHKAKPTGETSKTMQ
jgi:hypothetical protein